MDQNLSVDLDEKTQICPREPMLWSQGWRRLLPPPHRYLQARVAQSTRVRLECGQSPSRPFSRYLVAGEQEGSGKDLWELCPQLSDIIVSIWMLRLEN